MNPITIRIQSKAEFEQDGPLFPEYKDDPPAESELVAVGILEGGMESGKPSLWLAFEVGQITFSAQISYGQWDGITGALRGAIARWSEAAVTERKENGE